MGLEEQSEPRKGTPKGSRILPIGPTDVGNKSTGIFQVHMPEGDVHLRTLTMPVASMKYFIINEIRFKHRDFTNEEVAEYKRLDNVLVDHIRQFYARHGQSQCDACGRYGCTPPRSMESESDAFQPPACKHYDASKRPMVISEEARRSHDATMRALWLPIRALSGQCDTIVFNAEKSEAQLAQFRSTGELKLHGLLQAGRIATLSVSNHSDVHFAFSAKIVVEFA